jgi:UDP-N-acetylglucosamine:LPS N-acetylglucosamine transferase
LSTICKTLNEKGFIVLAKTRGKDPIREDHKKYFYRSFSDESWYPHTTMELIIASDLVINTGSTTIKECIMFDTPIINFNIKPFSNLPLHFLENYSFNRVMPKKDFKTSDLIDAIDYIENNNFKEEFQRARNDHLFQKDIKSSSKIIGSILES